jgi:hypothetical protein
MLHKLLSLHSILLITAFLAIAFSFYKYSWTKDYLFLVESSCNAQISECYVRDCDEEECPPNGLSAYRLFSVPAAQFGACNDNSCANVCSDGLSCEEILCSSQEEIECTSPHAAEQSAL